MNKIASQVCKVVSAFVFLSIPFHALQGTSHEDQKKEQMIQDLAIIKYNFETGYAPAEWKKEYAGWDIEEAFEQAKNEVLAKPSITTKQFHQIVRKFMYSMKDYHVDVLFHSTEKADLPFSVKDIEGRYFIDWVDSIRLSPAHHSIRTGDELLEFNNQSIVEVMDEIEQLISRFSNPQTDKALATTRLTKRQGAYGDIVPKGSIFITIRSAKSGKISKHQLHWSYTPEHVNNPFEFVQNRDFLSWLSFFKKEKSKIQLPKITMVSPIHQAMASECTERDGALGSRKSFLPEFGEIIWSNDQTDQKEETKDEIKVVQDENKNHPVELMAEDRKFWNAYIYRHPEGYKVGYIRIPHYLLDRGQMNEFGKMISMMEEYTHALVIDQVDNFGGLVQAQYQLAAMLTDKPLYAPYHRFKITQKEVLGAYEMLEMIKLVEKVVDGGIQFDVQKNEQEDDDDDQPDFQQLLFYKDYCENILGSWNKGLTLTDPSPVIGVDQINPHPKYNYTKPILMLINELDFSGGDFMPAILQDNQRAVLFGARTAGAGGCVSGFEFLNTNGIASCHYTSSIADRKNSTKLENLGVNPDVPYTIVLDDIQHNYRSYVKSANKAVHELLMNESIN